MAQGNINNHVITYVSLQLIQHPSNINFQVGKVKNLTGFLFAHAVLVIKGICCNLSKADI